MGRISMPIMNKTGYSMYWGSMWDEKVNYSKSLIENLFLKDFLYLFFENNSNMMHLDFKQIYKNPNLRKLIRTGKIKTRKVGKKDALGNILGYVHKKQKRFYKKYISKIWFLKYQSWFIVYFFCYTFNLSKIFKRKRRRTKFLRKYFNLITKYYINTIKLNNTYGLYSKFNKSVDF